MPKINLPRPVKVFLKLTISAVIIYLVLTKIDEGLLLEVVKEANWWWVIWAILWFVFSKIISAFRFNTILKAEDVDLSTKDNLRLYWLCMYYNLLLPGGISGDGYKIKVLMDWFGKPFKRMFTVTLVDRLSGLIALGQISVVLILYVADSGIYWAIALGALLVSFALGWYIFKWAGGKLAGVWLQTSFQSLGVQGSQALATLGLVFALGHGQHWAEYIILFLVSSVMAMIPITIGGAGARELTFLYGAQFLDIQAEKAVAIAFLFYIISSAVSFFGIVYSFNKERVFKMASVKKSSE